MTKQLSLLLLPDHLDQLDRKSLQANNFHAIPGCKSKCDKWNTIKYCGRYVSKYFEMGWVACSTCQVIFVPNTKTIKNKKYCKCCGKTIRLKMRQCNTEVNHRE